MLMTVLLAMAGLALLYFGGEWLVRGAGSIASRLGISPLAIGLTVVAFGTSAPELAVSIDAALRGAHDISVGNVVGSNIANIGLILGLAGLFAPAVVQARLVRVDAPLMVVVSLLLLLVLHDGTASRLEGGLLLAALLAWIVVTFRQARRETPPVQEEFAGEAPPAAPGLPVSIGLVLLGLGVLVGGGQLLVRAAVDIARTAGVSEATIGLTVVAIGTSLPEFATSVLAAARGRGDIAVGNVVGSNIFNILGILGGTALLRPLSRGSISGVDLGTMVAMAAVLALFLWTGRNLDRRESVVLLVGYVAYMGWLLA